MEMLEAATATCLGAHTRVFTRRGVSVCVLLSCWRVFAFYLVLWVGVGDFE